MSISTSASSAASGMRLYAVRSALASASSMISIEMPFSRSMFSSASIISEFMAVPVLLGADVRRAFLDFPRLGWVAHSNTVRACATSA